MKHTFPMRVFSVLLCVAMLCTFAPLTSLAKTAMPDVFVGGVQVTTQNAADILGDGAASFDKVTKTLTLKTLGLYKTYETEDGAAYGIYADGDLTVAIDGQVNIDLIDCVGKAHVAAIEATGDLTVTGCGSLSCVTPATASFSAGFAAGGSLVVDLDGAGPGGMSPVGDTLTLSAGKAPQSYALYGEDVTLTLAKVFFGAQAYTRLCNVTPTLKNTSFIHAMGAKNVDDMVTLNFDGNEIDAAFDGLRYITVFPYRMPLLEVAGTRVTLDNAADVLGDGTVSFDLKTGELVLNGATITDFCCDYAGGSPSDMLDDIAGIYTQNNLTIRLIGDNVIDLRDSEYEQIPHYNQGIYTCSGNLTLVGDGNLAIYAGPSQDADCGSYGAYIQDLYLLGNGDYTFCGASENADASYALSCDNIVVSPSRYEDDKAHGVRFVGETSAIEYFDESDEDALQFTTFDSHDVLCAQTTNPDDLSAADDADNTLSDAKYIFFASKELIEYDLWVGGVQVTTNNYADVLGDGTVSYEEYYDEEYDNGMGEPKGKWFRTLTLHNAAITDTYRYDDLDYEGNSHFAYEGIYSRLGDLILRLEGDNAIDMTGLKADDISYMDGIYCTNGGELVLEGSGSLSITLPDIPTDSTTGISQDTVVVNPEVSLTIIAPDYNYSTGIYAYAGCEIYSPNVFVTAGDPAVFVESSSGSLTVDYNYADAHASFSYNDTNAVKITNIESDYNLSNYRTISTSAPTYDLWVGGVQVSQENAYNIPCVSGSVYYNAYSEELTLDNAVINAGDIPFSLEMTMCGGIFSPVDYLNLYLYGNNVINVSSDEADGLIGIFAGDDLNVTGSGSLTINVEGSDAKRQVIGIFANNDVTLDNDGAITITVTGNEDMAGGLAAQNVGVYSRGGLNINTQGKETVAFMAYTNADLGTPAAVNVTATATSEDKVGEAMRVFSYLYLEPESGICSFDGSSCAINPEFVFSVSAGNLKMSAYTDQAGENKVDSPAMDDLANYKKLVFTQPYAVTPILTKTEAECSVEVSYGVFEGNNETAEIGWEVEGTPDYIHVLCDVDDDGSFGAYLENVEYGGPVTYFSRTAKGNPGDEDLTCTAHQWRLRADYADGTVAYSDPFTVTYYQMLRDYDLAVYPTMPRIGSTPETSPSLNHELYYSCKDEPIVTWYHIDKQTGAYEMASDEVFLPGESYGVTFEGTLVDTLRIEGDTLTAHVKDTDSAEVVNVDYDDANNSLFLAVMFDPLKTQLHALEVGYDIDETMTPADVVYTAFGRESSSPVSLPVTDGAVEAVWTYCNSDVYNEANARPLSDGQVFAAGRSYHLTLTVPLADRFGMESDPNYDCYGIYDDFDASYDPEENVVTFDILVGYFDPMLTSLDVIVFEPEAGLESGNTNEVTDSMYANATATWCEVEYAEGTGYTIIKTLDVRDQFEAGKSYIAVFNVALTNGACFPNPFVTFTVNGNEAYSDDTFVSEAIDPENAVVYALFTVPTAEAVKATALDFTVEPFTANNTPADVAVGFDDTLLSSLQVGVAEYLGEDAPESFFEAAAAMTLLDKNDRMEYGKTYLVRMSYVLKAGVAQDSATVINVNGEKAELVYFVDGKRGAVLALVTLDEPAVTLSADVTELELGDEALEAVAFDVAYDFEPTNAVVTVYDADEDEVLSAAIDGTKNSFTADLSSLEIGTYTVVVTAYDGANAITSNALTVEVKQAVIDEITILNADVTPVYGEKAGDHMAYTLPENAPYTVTMNGWWDVFNNRVLGDDDTFEANNVYSVWWNLVANEGYVFADDATILINGSTDVVDAEYSYLDVSGEEPLFIISSKGVFVEGPTEPTATATEPSATGTATEPTATATEPTATATGTQADEILYGDANGDGDVNMKDVLTLRKHLAGIEIMLHPLNSDANGDGEINMKDVLMIRKYMAGLIDKLGPTA